MKLIFNRRLIFDIFLCLLIGGYCYTPAADTKKTSPAKTPSSSSPVSDTKNDGYEPISFDILSDYEYVEPLNLNGHIVNGGKNKIPDRIKAFNGKKVAIRGYFYPVEIGEDGVITDFMLLRNPIQCCFGDAVQMNEWVSAAMTNGKTIKHVVPATIVTLYGTLEVGEKLENGSVSNLYRIKVDKIVEEK